MSDPVESRLARIRSYGATQVIDPVADFDPGAVQADAFIDCSGATQAVLDGIRSVRAGGAVVLVGLGAEDMLLPVQHIQNNEITLTGTFRYVDTWPKAIALATTGRVDLDSMVTARYPLEQAEAALNADDDPLSMKSVVVVHNDEGELR